MTFFLEMKYRKTNGVFINSRILITFAKNSSITEILADDCNCTCDYRTRC